MKKYNVFPTLIMQFNVTDVITDSDQNELVSLIDNLCENADAVDKYVNPQIQSKTFLFDETSPPVMKKLQQSFVNCCNTYFKESNQYNIEYVKSRAWFFKTWKSLEQLNQYHNHSPALLSGVFYLKNTKTGTIFRNPNLSAMDQTPISFPPNEGSWIIFPSAILHTNDVVTSENPRYIIAADYYGIKN